jgi:hypothetical protein
MLITTQIKTLPDRKIVTFAPKTDFNFFLNNKTQKTRFEVGFLGGFLGFIGRFFLGGFFIANPASRCTNGVLYKFSCMVPVHTVPYTVYDYCCDTFI